MNIPHKEFPLKVFPKKLQDMIRDVAKCYRTDIGFIGSMLLTILSTCIGNSLKFTRGEFKKFPFLWLIYIGEPGCVKSHPYRGFFEEPISVYNDNVRKSLKAQYDKLDKNEKKQKGEFFNSHFAINKFTHEGLRLAYAYSPRGFLLYLDEIASLIEGANQYKQGHGSDIPDLLTMYDGYSSNTFLVKGQYEVNNTACGMLGGIQPNQFRRVFLRPQFIERGLIGRFLLIRLTDPIGERGLKVTKNSKDIWKSLAEYALKITPKAMDNYKGYSPWARILSNDATKTWNDCCKSFDLLRAKVSKTDTLQYFFSKYESVLLSLAGILHVIKCWSSGIEKVYDVIPKERILEAYELLGYFLYNADSILNELQITREGPIDASEDQVTILSLLYTLMDKEKELSYNFIINEFNSRKLSLVDRSIVNSRKLGHLLSKLGITVKKLRVNGIFVRRVASLQEEIFDKLSKTAPEISEQMSKIAEWLEISGNDYKLLDKLYKENTISKAAFLELAPRKSDRAILEERFLEKDDITNKYKVTKLFKRCYALYRKG